MPDREKQPDDLDSMSLREKAYQQEAKALLAILVNYYERGGAMEDLQTTLGEMIRQSLHSVVTETLKDPEVQKTIKNEVADALVSKLKQELSNRQTSILSSVLDELLPEWQRLAEKGMKQLARPGKPEIQVAQPQAGSDPSTSPSPSPPPEPARPKLPRAMPQWLVPALVSLSVILLVAVLVLLGWRMQQMPKPRTDNDNNVETENLPDPRFATTMQVADAALPTGSPLMATIEAHPYTEQYRCWFDRQAREQLDYLVKHRDLDKATFTSMLLGAYNGCVKREYQLGTSKLPVFASQGTVLYLLRDQQKKGWELCADDKAPDGLPDLEKFQSNGERGRETYSLLNGFLTCTGYSSNLEIGPDSTAEEYLFAVYAALRELER
jgi:hypothetical protein